VTKTLLYRAVLAAAATVVATGCDESADESAGGDVGETGQDVASMADTAAPDAAVLDAVAEGTGIGPGGGTIRFGEGGLLVVHPGATATTVTISVVEAVAPRIEGLVAAGPFFEFRPDGTEFAIPVDVTLPLDAGARADGAVVVWSTRAGAWTRIASEASDGASALRAMVSHFSRGGAAAPAAEAEWVCCAPDDDDARIIPAATCAPEHTRADTDECEDVCCAQPGGGFERTPAVLCERSGGEPAIGACSPVPCIDDRHCARSGVGFGHAACTRHRCQAGECRFEAFDDGTACDDSDVCTENDRCTERRCAGEPLDCDDGNECTADACGPDGCMSIALPDGGACTPGDACNATGECRAGACVVVSETPCDDNDVCTADACVAGECVFDPLAAGTQCDDQNVCTLDTVCDANGACGGGTRDDCDDSDPCTTDACHPVMGCNHAVAGGGGCDDGNDCTINDQCDAMGQCGGRPSGALRCAEVCCVEDGVGVVATHGSCVSDGGTPHVGDAVLANCEELACCFRSGTGDGPWRVMPRAACGPGPAPEVAACEDMVCCFVDQEVGSRWVPRPVCATQVVPEGQCGHRHEFGRYNCETGDDEWASVSLMPGEGGATYGVRFEIVTDWDGHRARRIYVPVPSDDEVRFSIWGTYDHCNAPPPDAIRCDGVGFWAYEVDNPDNGGGGGARSAIAVQIDLAEATATLRTEMWGWPDDENQRDHNFDWHVEYRCDLARTLRVNVRRGGGGITRVVAEADAHGFECTDTSCYYAAGEPLTLSAETVPGFRVHHWIDLDTGQVHEVERLALGPLSRAYSLEVVGEQIPGD